MDQPPAIVEPAPSSTYTIKGSRALSIDSIQQPLFFIIACGKGSVTISMETGHAEFKDCTPNQAARQFWKAVEGMK